MKREKINKKGFTLIEMLGAVAILGIIATIGIVSVSKVIASAHKKFDNTQYETFMQAGEAYFTDSKSKLPLTPMDWKEITLQELINKKYIEKILDSNKNEFDYEKSKVVVTRLTSGKYQYEAILVRKKGNPIGKISNKVTNQNSGIVFQLRNKNKYYSEDKTYYVRDYPIIDLSISDTDQLSGYQYIIYKNGKQFKKSENIEVSGGVSVNEAITLGKEFSFGKYSIKVVAYDKSGNKTTNSTDNNRTGDSFYLYIDRIKPNCSISIDGKAGDNGWYKEKDITLTLKESDKESGISKHDFQTSKSFPNLDTLNTISTLVRKQSDTGSTTWYAHVEDKAGNVCETEVNVKVDTSKPNCQILSNPKPPKSPEPIDSNKWYGVSTKNDIETIKIGYSDEGPSGIAKYIIAKENKNLKRDYKKFPNIETVTTEEGEFTYNGYVRDNAGNDKECDVLLRKDTIPPNCNTSVSSPIFYVGTSEAGYSPSVTFSTTIIDPTVVNASVSLGIWGYSDVGDTCSYTSNEHFNNLSVGQVLIGSMAPCRGYSGDIQGIYNLMDRAGNWAFCETERIALEPTKKRGCTDYQAENYDSTAEEDDGSCWYAAKCTDIEATNYGEKGSCIYEEKKKEKCNDTEAENYGEEGDCKYKDGTPVSCANDLKISYTFATDKNQSSYSTTANTTFGYSPKQSNLKWTRGVKVAIEVSENVESWLWSTNETERRDNVGSNFKDWTESKGNAEKTLTGEGVRQGKITLKSKDGKSKATCYTDTYGVDITPPKLEAVCPFFYNKEDKYTEGFFCKLNGVEDVYVPAGVIIKVVDQYLPIGNDSAGNGMEVSGNCKEGNCNRYQLKWRSQKEDEQGNIHDNTTDKLTRVGSDTNRENRYCISTKARDFEQKLHPRVTNILYDICDKLGNCTGGAFNNNSDNWLLATKGYTWSEGTCDNVREEHSCYHYVSRVCP